MDSFASSSPKQQHSAILREEGDTSDDHQPIINDAELDMPPLATPGLSSCCLNLDVISPSMSLDEPDETRERKKCGRPKKRQYFFGNRFTSAEEPPSKISKTKHLPRLVLPRRGYTSSIKIPRTSKRDSIIARRKDDTEVRVEALRPIGMRLIDMTILGDVFRLMKCESCHRGLTLYEQKWLHGWQTIFLVKCNFCHRVAAEFPSSKPLNTPSHHTLVNVHHNPKKMTDVTMRSVIAMHSTSMSWRDLHKFATIFDMPPPHARIPSTYVDHLFRTTNLACKQSMLEAAKELRSRTDAIPSPEQNSTNVTVSFDSSWKTRGYYSNIGFGAAISTVSKKVLDYELLSRLCEKCNIWSVSKKKDKPLEYGQWYKLHQPNCLKNFEGSSQSMEPEAAKRIWSRSISTNNLVYSVFVGDGDSKSFQTITCLDPYTLVKVRKEECLLHVVKRLKKGLKKIKNNTKNNSYVQHKLSEEKADYIAAKYSTVVLQNRGKSAAEIEKKLSNLLAHASGLHENCPGDSWCRWKQTAISKPPVSTIFKSNDISKLKEVFSSFASPEFCSHITLGLTQNANESLHNTIWNLVPKSKYVSPITIHISIMIAILIFNEGELSIYRLLSDLGLETSPSMFHGIVARDLERKRNAIRQSESNAQRKRRRLQKMKISREKNLLKAEGGRSYQGGRYGVEASAPNPRGRVCGRVSQASKVLPRNLKCSSESLNSSLASYESSLDDDDTNCSICEKKEPPSSKKRKIGKIIKRDLIDWLECPKCKKWYHCDCAEISLEDATKNEFICLTCCTK